MRAYFYQDPLKDPLAQIIRLVVVDDRMGARTYLGEDNAWHTMEEAAPATVAPGIALPMGAIEAIAKAVDEHLGKSSHGNTEVRVLREWLAVEQARVERALGGPA